jgi:hypothetical protein
LEGLGRIGGDKVLGILSDFIQTSQNPVLTVIAENIVDRLTKKRKPAEDIPVTQNDSGGMSQQEILKYKEMLKRLNKLGK